MDNRTFFERYRPTNLTEDPLPLKVLNHSIKGEFEMMGHALDWTSQYLHQKTCPGQLLSPLLALIQVELKGTDLSQCLSNHSNDETDGTSPKDAMGFQPLKLMQTVTTKVDEICLKYKEEFEKIETEFPTSENGIDDPKIYEISYHSIKNARRTLEDRMVIIPNLQKAFENIEKPAGYFAVFDGHNGSEAAAYGAAHLHRYLIASKDFPSSLPAAFLDAYTLTDNFFISKCRSEKIRSGSTAVTALIDSENLTVAWVGDSQGILVRQKEIMNLVSPHKPERDDEMKRIRMIGGDVLNLNGTWRVNGNLAVSRALGNFDYKDFIISFPEIASIKLDGTEEFLILACDGLWDEVSSEAAAEIVRNFLASPDFDTTKVAADLVTSAKSLGSTDNITCIVVFLQSSIVLRSRYNVSNGSKMNGITEVNGNEEHGGSNNNEVNSKIMLAPVVNAGGATEDDPGELLDIGTVTFEELEKAFVPGPPLEEIESEPVSDVEDLFTQAHREFEAEHRADFPNTGSGFFGNSVGITNIDSQLAGLSLSSAGNAFGDLPSNELSGRNVEAAVSKDLGFLENPPEGMIIEEYGASNDSDISAEGRSDTTESECSRGFEVTIIEADAWKEAQIKLADVDVEGKEADLVQIVEPNLDSPVDLAEFGEPNVKVQADLVQIVEPNLNSPVDLAEFGEPNVKVQAYPEEFEELKEKSPGVLVGIEEIEVKTPGEIEITTIKAPPAIKKSTPETRVSKAPPSGTKLSPYAMNPLPKLGTAKSSGKAAPQAPKQVSGGLLSGKFPLPTKKVFGPLTVDRKAPAKGPMPQASRPQASRPIASGHLPVLDSKPFVHKLPTGAKSGGVKPPIGKPSVPPTRTVTAPRTAPPPRTRQPPRSAPPSRSGAGGPLGRPVVTIKDGGSTGAVKPTESGHAPTRPKLALGLKAKGVMDAAAAAAASCGGPPLDRPRTRQGVQEAGVKTQLKTKTKTDIPSTDTRKAKVLPGMLKKEGEKLTGILKKEGNKLPGPCGGSRVASASGGTSKIKETPSPYRATPPSARAAGKPKITHNPRQTLSAKEAMRLQSPKTPGANDIKEAGLAKVEDNKTEIEGCEPEEKKVEEGANDEKETIPLGADMVEDTLEN